ncbi:helix-turn-helix domain-containing protein [Streptomyces sp. DG2A-72]|uniref:helix-turn-helix domain-containing protein n=1 Tax=Streptomyces sp. DG2A-72 TaxID=3051386 RepID=UPI00265B7773|nr:helix-turn-helix domain-containing protein [Streptomyces sp. DG2A-72]MDO0934843.1 helix-turn-helix domain-containing protein [Streptomyces sp. DG2A-72]
MATRPSNGCGAVRRSSCTRHVGARIAHETGLHLDTVRAWRGQFAHGGRPALADRKRSGRPARFTPVRPLRPYRTDRRRASHAVPHTVDRTETTSEARTAAPANHGCCPPTSVHPDAASWPSCSVPWGIHSGLLASVA